MNKQKDVLRTKYHTIDKRITLAAVLIAFSVLMPALVHDMKGSRDLNVLLITLDTTRADRLGCYGYERAETPNLDAIAAGGVRFAEAYTPVPLTLPSHCSLFTGTYPPYHGARNNGFYYLDDWNVTLTEILKERGFMTAAFVASFTVDSRFGLAQGFDVYDDTFRAGEILKSFRSERRAEDVFNSFSRWLGDHSGGKFFSWVHFYDPHLPYAPPPPFQEKFAGRPYDGEVAYMDHFVGKIMDKLREKNIHEKTLVVIAGDHGEALGERREMDHGLFLYDNTLRVPLILWAGGHLPEGAEIDARACLIDVMPTVLDLIGIPVPEEIQGESLAGAIRGKKRKQVPVYIETCFPWENYGWSPLSGLIKGRWKCIKAPKPELYDLARDPRENLNLVQIEAGIARRMLAELDETVREIRSGRAEGRRKLTEEEERRLRSLGYMGGEAAAAKTSGPLPDPKDKIEDYVLYFRGNLHETRGEYRKAARLYKEVLVRNPDVPNNYVNLGFLYAKMDRMDEAIRVLEKGREKIPGSPAILSRLLSFYSGASRYEEALRTGGMILQLDSRNFDALFLSGSIQAKLGNWEQALGFYEKAREIEPENKTLRRRCAYTMAALGYREEAFQRYRRLSAEYPGDAKIHKELSEIYSHTADWEEAAASLRKALELAPAPEMCHDYAILLEKTGRLEAAIKWLRRYLEQSEEKNSLRWKKARSELARWEKRMEKK